MSSAVVAAGTTKSVSNVPAGAAVGVSPGSGGTMLMQYRISPEGPLRNWDAGVVTLDADDVMRMPVAEVVFTATTEDGLAEWLFPDAGYGR